MTEKKESIAKKGMELESMDPQKIAGAIGRKILDKMAIAYEIEYLFKTGAFSEADRNKILAQQFIEYAIKRDLRPGESVMFKKSGNEILFWLNSDDDKAVEEVFWDWCFQYYQKPEDIEIPVDLSFFSFFKTLSSFTKKYIDLAMDRGEKDAEKYVKECTDDTLREMMAGLAKYLEEGFDFCSHESKDGTVDQTRIAGDFAKFMVELYLNRKLRPYEHCIVNGDPADLKNVFGKIEISCMIKKDGELQIHSTKMDMDILSLRLTNEFLEVLINEETKNDRG